VGDISGLISKLDYLRVAGVDAVVTAFYFLLCVMVATTLRITMSCDFGTMMFSGTCLQQCQKHAYVMDFAVSHTLISIPGSRVEETTLRDLRRLLVWSTPIDISGNSSIIFILTPEDSTGL